MKTIKTLALFANLTTAGVSANPGPFDAFTCGSR
jgi:hypothetical protein